MTLADRYTEAAWRYALGLDRPAVDTQRRGRPLDRVAEVEPLEVPWFVAERVVVDGDEEVLFT